jgi:hypothetical protein
MIFVMRLPFPLILSGLAVGQLFPAEFNFNSQLRIKGLSGVSHVTAQSRDATNKDAFLDSLVANLTVPELGMSLFSSSKDLAVYVCISFVTVALAQIRLTGMNFHLMSRIAICRAGRLETSELI